jgi:glycosyltransferase involved in cell wall biosynthesis
LLVASSYFESHKGGIEIVAGEIARALAAKQGFQVAWLAADSSRSPSDGIVRAVPIRTWNVVERLLGLPLPLPLPSALSAILREVQGADVIMVHDTLYLSSLVAMLAAKWARKPILVVQHIGLVPYRNPIPRGLMKLADRFISRPMLANADQVVFISGLTERHFSDVRFQRTPQLIFNGIRKDFCADSSQDVYTKQKSNRQFTSIFVGRFVEKKGLQVLRRLAASTPEIRWLICGWGNERPEDWGLANVEVRRNLDAQQLHQAYGEADLLVLPSVGEGLPLVVQEAMALGLRVIGGADLLDADPWLRGRISGVDVDPKDPVATARRWRSEIDVIRRNYDRSDSSEQARARYNWANISNRYAAIVNELAERAQLR